MHQRVENTAYCLNYTNEWPAPDGETNELSLTCPKCQWRLAVPVELISSGWWTTEDFAA
jgi:hypothetical protein